MGCCIVKNGVMEEGRIELKQNEGDCSFVDLSIESSTYISILRNSVVGSGMEQAFLGNERRSSCFYEPSDTCYSEGAN